MADTPVAPLLVSAKAAAKLCGISLRTWWALNSAGKTPAPVHLGGRTLWKTQGPNGLTAWILANCPSRNRLEAMKGGRRL